RRIHFGWQCELPHELAVRPLDLVELLPFFFLLPFPLAFVRQAALEGFYLVVLCLDIRQFGLDQELLVAFLDLDQRRPISKERPVVGRRRQPTVDKPIQAILDVLEFAKRSPSNEIHKASFLAAVAPRLYARSVSTGQVAA